MQLDDSTRCDGSAHNPEFAAFSSTNLNVSSDFQSLVAGIDASLEIFNSLLYPVYDPPPTKATLQLVARILEQRAPFRNNVVRRGLDIASDARVLVEDLIDMCKRLGEASGGGGSGVSPQMWATACQKADTLQKRVEEEVPHSLKQIIDCLKRDVPVTQDVSVTQDVPVTQDARTQTLSIIGFSLAGLSGLVVLVSPVLLRPNSVDTLQCIFLYSGGAPNQNVTDLIYTVETWGCPKANGQNCRSNRTSLYEVGTCTRSSSPLMLPNGIIDANLFNITCCREIATTPNPLSKPASSDVIVREQSWISKIIDKSSPPWISKIIDSFLTSNEISPPPEQKATLDSYQCISLYSNQSGSTNDLISMVEGQRCTKPTANGTSCQSKEIIWNCEVGSCPFMPLPGISLNELSEANLLYATCGESVEATSDTILSHTTVAILPFALIFSVLGLALLGFWLLRSSKLQDLPLSSLKDTDTEMLRKILLADLIEKLGNVHSIITALAQKSKGYCNILQQQRKQFESKAGVWYGSRAEVSKKTSTFAKVLQQSSAILLQYDRDVEKLL